jgi:hypothetical protein
VECVVSPADVVATQGDDLERRLEVYQAMWAMEGLPFGSSDEWTIEERISQIADAGFHGAGISFSDANFVRTVTRELERHDLKWIAICFPQSVEEFRQILDLAAETGLDRLDHINLQPDVRPFALLECIPLILGWQDLADEAGVHLHFENHRGRMTTDLRFTIQLLDALPQIKMTADLSHFVVGQEFRYPISDEDHALIRRVLERTWAYHGRVASREQVQLQHSFAHHQPWLELFAGWWRQGFQYWRDSAPPGSTLTFMSELGPPGWYAMTGPDGVEFSDMWHEALQLKQLVEQLWLELDRGA